ncbi:hypothetical protein ACQY0O_008335 [Thecaphora frezii]
MPWDDFRHNLNKRLDDFGDDAMKKMRAQREANASTSSSDRIGVKERFHMLKGDNPRWNHDVERRRAQHGEDQQPTPAVGGRRMAPAVPGAVPRGGKPPLPPPVRSAAGGTRQTVTASPPPPPPPRMANENGTSFPPPPYVPAHAEAVDAIATATQQQQQQTISWPIHPDGYVQFSRFTQQDKEAFWDLLDQYFDQKQRLR